MNTLFTFIIVVQVLSALAIIGLVLVQRYPGSPVAAAFQPLVYQALTKSQ